jgi:hypothetical protein
VRKLTRATERAADAEEEPELDTDAPPYPRRGFVGRRAGIRLLSGVNARNAENALDVLDGLRVLDL